jgi:SNF2 family DNA or RNA helicase
MNSAQLAAFAELSPQEQTVLLALAVVYTPIGQTTLQELLKKSGAFPKDNLLMDRTLREKLQSLKLIVILPEGSQCHSTAVESLMELAVQQTWFEQFANFILNSPPPFSHAIKFSFLYALKKLRLYLYLNKHTAFCTEFARLTHTHYRELLEANQKIFFQNFSADWFAGLNPAIQFAVLDLAIKSQLNYLTTNDLHYQLLETHFGHSKPHDIAIVYTVLEQRLLRGNFTDIEVWLQDDQSSQGLRLLASVLFLQNRNDEALAIFALALKNLKKESKKRNISLSGLPGVFYSLALLATRKPTQLNLLKQQLDITLKYGQQDEFYLLNSILLEAVDMYQGKLSVDHAKNLFKTNNLPYERLIQILLLYWLGEEKHLYAKHSHFISGLADFCLQAHKQGFVWYAALSAGLLQRLNYEHKACALVAQHYQDSAFLFLLDLLPQVTKWQRALLALSKLKEPTINATDAPETRLIWSVFLRTPEQILLEPKEQKLGKNSRWSKGRPIALKRLIQNRDEFDYLTEHDLRICNYIKVEIERSYHSAHYGKEVCFMDDEAIFAAIGHPHLYWSENDALAGQALQLISKEPQLLVKEQGKSLHISIIPKISKHNMYAEKAVNNSLHVYKINEQHRQVAEILGKQGLSVPVSARQQVIDSIASIASLVTIQSDIGGSSSHAETVIADTRLHLHLQPIGYGLQIEVFVQPFRDGGPLYCPASGGKTVMAEIEGKQLQTQRDVAQEKNNLQRMLDACPELYPEKEAKWLLDDPELALEALLHLQNLDEFVVLEWPKGKKIHISQEADLHHVQFSVRKEKDWFSVTGSLQINEQEVIDMQQLMHLLSRSPSRFLKLEDGQFIALTRELRQRLDDMTHLGDTHKDKINFHTLAAHALDEITTGMSIKASKPWQEQLRRLEEVTQLNPTLPTTLQGELREYQREGFAWLSRLAYWGAGACLADDMGLGKTVQALALILSRAPQGPTLILAPTSVCINWLEEAQRFAPTLNVAQFGSGDRQAMLDNAGPFDLIICSYGLLQSEAERLAEKSWHTLVADEAQAIKNMLTKRSKAAMSLQADFKFITTGTPIENHLGEIWNLFNFINPGLLGSLNQFNDRFAHPIENQRNHEAKYRLKKLLRPFILRRLKSDVLSELPARTEVTVHVDLSAAERAMYEALRRNAMQTLLEDSGQAGQKHLKVLAEIMKLRRACCHPRLVMEDSQLSSAKLEAFDELVTELLENKHKALVFSQFVGHLSLIRELLDKKGIDYHYLDGSTPAAQRKLAMNAFQAGNGDLFLISLKAGGTGLNLTAADYVIHMDPWWNPAVEDQASDRAHRMGQKRPVTIYRLVAKNTIEDKIVELHAHKRDLANNLLEGGEVSGKMSVEEMMALLRDSVGE